MIKLTRFSAPRELDRQTRARLTRTFLATGEAVWNQSYIRDTLFLMSHKKCSYCEAFIGEESKYMEVDHFHPKGAYPRRVVEWHNLLASCKRCNVEKGTHDVAVDGTIVNPFVDDPRTHLKLYNYRLRGKTDVGKRTIEAIYLNDTDRLVSVRMRIGNAIIDTLERLRQDLASHIAGARNRLYLNRVTRGLHKLFDEASAPSEYSATAATILLADHDYKWIKAELIALSLWAPFAPREAVARNVVLT